MDIERPTPLLNLSENIPVTCNLEWWGDLQILASVIHLGGGSRRGKEVGVSEGKREAWASYLHDHVDRAHFIRPKVR